MLSSPLLHILPLKDDNDRRDILRIRVEILIVLSLSFGTAGVRAILRYIEALSSSASLNEQKVSLTPQQSPLVWIDPALQFISSGVLLSWGGLALFLLFVHISPGKQFLRRLSSLSVSAVTTDIAKALGLSALIGIPGLFLYRFAVENGYSTVVVTTDSSQLWEHWWTVPLLILHACANGFAEELVVIAWLMIRLRQLGLRTAWIILLPTILRASYHFYQGTSAGIGNAVMGAIFALYFWKTGKVMPLIIAHSLIDIIAFVGYPWAQSAGIVP